MNFIIRIYRHTDTTYSFVGPSLTTFRIDVADYGDYEILLHIFPFIFLQKNN